MKLKEPELKKGSIDVSKILLEINSLVALRQYMLIASNSYSLKKESVNYLIDSLHLIDVKITELLQSEQFKQYIGYVK